MDAQTELDRALSLIDDLVGAVEGLPEMANEYGGVDYYEMLECLSIKSKAEDFLRKHKRIP